MSIGEFIGELIVALVKQDLLQLVSVRDFFVAPAVWPQVIRAKNSRLRAAKSVLNCFRRRVDVTMRSSSCIGGADTFYLRPGVRH